MATNLATRCCPKCDYELKLEDVLGKPLELRASDDRYAPNWGVKFECQCGSDFFVIIRRVDEFWSEESLRNKTYEQSVLTYGQHSMINNYVNRFVWVCPVTGKAHNTGFVEIDLSFYHSMNDEDYPEKYLCPKQQKNYNNFLR